MSMAQKASLTGSARRHIRSADQDVLSFDYSLPKHRSLTLLPLSPSLGGSSQKNRWGRKRTRSVGQG